MANHKRILFNILILFGTFCAAGLLHAQPQQLPRIQEKPQIQQVSQVAPTGTPPSQTDASGSPLFLNLTRMTPEKLEQALRQICGHRFAVKGQYQYLISVEQNKVRSQSVLRIEPQARRVALSGDKQLCDQVFLLITAIDREPPKGKIRQIIPYQYTQPDVLVQALNALRVQPPVAPPQNEAVARLMNQPGPIQQVQYQFQDSGFDSAGVELPGFPGTDMQGFQQPGAPPSFNMIDGFGGYMLFPQLDALAIEAEGQRLAKFTEMIRQLEELSQLYKPEIEIVHLKHVNSTALAAGGAGVIFQLYTEMFSPQYSTIPGQVRCVPMITPNAVLLIGWGKQMETMRELIKSLDLPTASEHSRLHFFKLKHISASQARTIIQGAFPPPMGPSGFMPRIQTFIDARTNALIVQADPNDLNELERIIAEIDVPSAKAKLQVKPFKLKNTLAPDLASTLTGVLTGATADGKSHALELLIQSPEGQKFITSGILSDAKVQPDIRNNVLIVTAPESCMSFIEELIKMLDTGSPEAVIKVYEIVNGDAESLVTMLKALLPSNVEGASGPQLPGSANEEALIPMRFSVDPRTNCILAIGSSSDLQAVEALLERLDQADSLSRKQKVIALKNTKATPAAATINKFITDQMKVMQESRGVISPYQQIESAVIVVADAESNSLIISATPRYFDDILSLVDEIDKSPPQVNIQVLIAEILLSEGDEWSSELGLQDPLMFARGNPIPGLLFNKNASTSLGDGTASPGTVGTQVISNFGGQRVGASGFGGLVFSASSDYINIQIRALQDKKRLEVLSSPKIMAMNNQEATISVGQDIPVYESNMSSSGVTQGGIGQISVELKLTVKPTISPDGTIVMDVTAKNDKVGSMMQVAEGMSAPQLDKTEVSTMISAGDGETVVLGGLISKTDDKITRKIPVLGDMPLLGKMFRQDISQKKRTELLIILTPRIVREQEDMEQVKQMSFARMSWCLTNVVETYGELGAYNVVSEKPYTGNAPVVSPAPVKMKDLQPMESFPSMPFPLAPTLPKRD